MRVLPLAGEDAAPAAVRPKVSDDAGGGGGSPADAGAPAAPAKPTLALSGVGSYVDGTESHEKITYTVNVPAGQTPGDYCLVQEMKGSAKTGSGSYFKIPLYGSPSKDWNLPDWGVDSIDADPIYWSNSSGRWNYTLSGQKFTATDDPGPALDSEKGAVYAIKFRVAVYKTADVPTTTTGAVGATAVSPMEFWDYSVKVGTDGKFTHPAI
jgi:hypothetical protein